MGHVWGEERIVVEEGRTLCENGGMIVHTCEVCGVTEAKTELAMGHDVKEWMEASAPTLTKGGEIYGACERCGKKVTKALPALNEKDYTYTVIKEKENCSDTDEVEYTYTVDENNSFTYKVTLSPSSHKLNGEEMPDDKTYDSQKYPDIKVPVNVDVRRRRRLGRVRLRRMRRIGQRPRQGRPYVRRIHFRQRGSRHLYHRGL